MRRTATAIFTVALLAGASPAIAAVNSCQAPPLSCATTMPVGGYCECTSKKQTESGTVVAKAPPRKMTNSTAGGCGAQPNAPGCK